MTKKQKLRVVEKGRRWLHSLHHTSQAFQADHSSSTVCRHSRFLCGMTKSLAHLKNLAYIVLYVVRGHTAVQHNVIVFGYNAVIVLTLISVNI